MSNGQALILLCAAVAVFYLYRQKQAEAAPAGAGASAFIGNANMIAEDGTSLGAVLNQNADEFRALLARLGF